MSSLLGAAQARAKPDPEPVESIQQIKVDASRAARNRRRSLIGTGRASTMFAGIQTATKAGLERRLG